jgi:hypothetical protein
MTVCQNMSSRATSVAWPRAGWGVPMPRAKVTRHDYRDVLAALGDGDDLDGLARDVHRAVFVQGRSIRWAASNLGVRRRDVWRAVDGIRERVGRAPS